MRFAFVGLAAAFTLLALGAPPSDAQISFFSKRYCTFGGESNSSGEPDCSYNTWEQCRASASGLARWCGENPQYVEPARGTDRPSASPKRKTQTKRNN